VLAFINNRRIPVLVRGNWDFAGILMGLAGFLLLSGPIILAAVDSAWHSAWTRGDMIAVRQWYLEQGNVRAAFWGFYYVLLMSVIFGLVYRRRLVSIVYNIDLIEWGTALSQATAFVGRTVVSRPDGFWISRNPSRANPAIFDTASGNDSTEILPGGIAKFAPEGTELIQIEPTGQVAIAASSTAPLTPLIDDSASRPFLMQVEPFYAARNLTITWGDATPADRAMLERALDRTFESSYSDANPASSLMLTAASCLFFLSLFSVVFLFSSLFFGVRR